MQHSIAPIQCTLTAEEASINVCSTLVLRAMQRQWRAMLVYCCRYAKLEWTVVLCFWDIRKKYDFFKQINIKKLCVSTGEMFLDDMCRIGRRSYSSYFDVNRPSFHKDFFYIFVPSDLDLWPFDLKFASAVPATRVQSNISIKFEVSTAFGLRVSRMNTGQTDRQTDGRTCTTLMRPPREGRVIMHMTHCQFTGGEINKYRYVTWDSDTTNDGRVVKPTDCIQWILSMQSLIRANCRYVWFCLSLSLLISLPVLLSVFVTFSDTSTETCY